MKEVLAELLNLREDPQKGNSSIVDFERIVAKISTFKADTPY